MRSGGWPTQQSPRETLREIVELAGCSAITAENGSVAMTLLATQHPCLVIIDLLMPVMSGTELIEAMKAQPHLATLPMLISSSAPERAPAGIPLLSKPFEMVSALEWIRRSCRCDPPLSS